MREWRIEPIAERLQAAALDAALWPEALDQIGRSADSFGAVLFSTNPHFVRPPASVNLVPATEAYMREGWHTHDERYKGIPKIQRTGIAVDEDFTSREMMQRSPYYQEFLRTHGIGPFAGIGFRAGSDIWVVSVQRRGGQAAFSPREQQRLLELWRPMSDAATLSRQLGFARVLGITDAFQHTSQPCIVLNDNGKVLAMNALASALVGRLFELRRDKVVLYDHGSQSNFDNLLHRLRGDPRTGRPSPLIAGVKDLVGNSAVLRAIILHGWARFSFTNASAIILIATARLSDESAVPAIVAAYGLTLTEARFAAALLSGQSPQAIARRSGISYETARSHLKSIFSKTATHRQGELIARLSQCVANGPGR